ncbi:MAG: GYDIA family GHMP kinase [Bacteroidota bacterium]
MSNSRFYSNGKLLLTGEYAVLDGALALAIPTRFGQSLEITENPSGQLSWQSFDADGSSWFEATFSVAQLDLLATSHPQMAARLGAILKAARKKNTTFLAKGTGIVVKTHTTFPRDWGLGTSSTLINNIAEWAHVDPYALLQASFGGSGYDIACASHTTALLYQLQGKTPKIKAVPFAPSFKEQLFFVYLNQKQNSEAAVALYNQKHFDRTHFITEISELTRQFISAETLESFEAIIARHEGCISAVLDQPPVKERLFPDYFGAIKSLGAWGGDFILVTGNEKTPDYFADRGFHTILSFEEMAL